MKPETANPPDTRKIRRFKRLCILAFFLVVLGWAGWYFGVELPERREAKELADLQATNARTIPGLNIELAWIPKGTFLMGTPEQSWLDRLYHDWQERMTWRPNEYNWSRDNERPATWVTLTQPFWLGRTNVTQAQWIALMGSAPVPLTTADELKLQSFLTTASGYNQATAKGPDLPMESISWDDAMAFCQKLTERERTAGRLPAGYIYTLPTEAQWEYACRAGTTGPFAGKLSDLAWCEYNNPSQELHPVGTKLPNAWGLFDMHGNQDWCYDRYHHYPGGSITDPTGPGPDSEERRVIRGGNYALDFGFCGSASREAMSPSTRGSFIGFRVALVPVRAR